MLVLKRCISFTSFLKMELPLSLVVRCYRGRLPVCVFHCRSWRTVSSQNSQCFLPAHRCETRWSCYRGFSSPPPVREDSVGKIQSTHYHLIYTCKVVYSRYVTCTKMFRRLMYFYTGVSFKFQLLILLG